MERALHWAGRGADAVGLLGSARYSFLSSTHRTAAEAVPANGGLGSRTAREERPGFVLLYQEILRLLVVQESHPC